MEIETRKAIAFGIMLALELPQKKDEDLLTVKAAREIFHAKWSNDDMELLCEHIKEHGASDWAEKSWENDVDQIYKQLYLFSLKATDFQLALWLEKILGGEKALKFLCSCEEELD